jgi:hypothetical protein
MKENKGFHSIRELQQLTKDLRYLRYFPATSNFDPADKLRCDIVPNDKTEVRKLRMELRDRYKKKYPHLHVVVTSHPDDGYITLEIGNGDEWGKMTKEHFDGAVIVERELEAMGTELGFTLAVSADAKENGFDPKNYD